MKVSQLIELLGYEDPDKEVYFAYPAGDHWHTTIAKTPRDVEACPLKYSEYHREMTVVDEDEDTAADFFVVLS